MQEQRWNAELTSMMTDVLVSLAAEVGDELFSLFNPEGAFNVRDPGVTRAIARRVTKVVGINRTTADEIRATLTDGEAAGESIDALARRIRGVFGRASTTRARTIARTEVIGATNESQLEAARQSGTARTKQWLAAHDARTRPSHAAADGQTVALDISFSVGGTSLAHPGDPSGPGRETINCRCTVIYGTAGDPLGSRTSLIEPTPEPEEIEDVIARLSDEQREIIRRPYSQWGTGARNKEARDVLKSTPEGRTLLRAADQFQATQGGTARYRTAVDDVLRGRGADLPVATRENAEALIDAIRTTPPDGKTLYRGLKIKGDPEKVLASYAEGGTVDLGMSSFSSNQTVANHFAKFRAKRGETQVSIRVEAPDQALPLSSIAKTKHTADLREYLMGGRFEVVSARKTGTSKVALVLRQVAGL